jgi:hypothetical protein
LNPKNVIWTCFEPLQKCALVHLIFRFYHYIRMIQLRLFRAMLCFNGLVLSSLWIFVWFLLNREYLKFFRTFTLS